jgi:hypothetical protein
MNLNVKATVVTRFGESVRSRQTKVATPEVIKFCCEGFSYVYGAPTVSEENVYESLGVKIQGVMR